MLKVSIRGNRKDEIEKFFKKIAEEDIVYSNVLTLSNFNHLSYERVQGRFIIVA